MLIKSRHKSHWHFIELLGTTMNKFVAYFLFKYFVTDMNLKLNIIYTKLLEHICMNDLHLHNMTGNMGGTLIDYVAVNARTHHLEYCYLN